MSNRPVSRNTLVSGYFILVAIATCAAYYGVTQSEILRWDDNVYLNSELVQSLAPRNLLAILTSQHHSNWHPLTTLSFAVEHALWGIDAVYMKFTNILLHVINAFLFYLLSYRLLLLATEDRNPAAASGIGGMLLEDREKFALYSSLAAAALFALHPQHVESVAWIAERKGLLCAMFYLATLISYIKSETDHSSRHANLTVIFMLLALMSKPMAVSLPVALMLLDIYPLRKIERIDVSLATLKILLRGKAIYILLAIASVVITLLFQDPQGGAVFDYLPRLINACAAYLHYLTTLFYPLELSPFYPFLEFSLQPSLVSLVPILVFIALVWAVIALYRRGIHYPLVIFAFYVISLLPVIGIVKVGRQAMADRYAYLPTMWFYLLLGVALVALFLQLRRRGRQHIASLLFVAICVSLGATTLVQTRHWQNDVLLWERVIEIYPDSASIAYVNLASAHDARGSMGIDEIETLINKALSLDPDNPYNLGAAANFYGQLGDEQKALELLLEIVRVAPYKHWAQAQIGDIYFNRDDFANAGNYYLAAIRHGSDSAEILYRLALIDLRFHRFADALVKLDLLPADKLGAREQELRRKIEAAMAISSQ